MSPLQPLHQPLPVPQRHQPGHHQGNTKDAEPPLAALTLFGQGGGRAGGGERGCDQHSPKDEAPPGQHPTAAATARRLGSATPTPWGPRAGAGRVSAGPSAPLSCEGGKQSQGRTGCTPHPQPAPLSQHSSAGTRSAQRVTLRSIQPRHHVPGAGQVPADPSAARSDPALTGRVVFSCADMSE